jgi:hypothetical protein
MKSTSFILLGCGFAICSFFACQPTTPPAATAEKKTTPNQRVLTVEDTISLAKFNLWTDNWKQSRDNPPYVEYFTMENIDLSEVLEESPAKVVYYMGLDNTTTPATPHLILVGVDAENRKMLDYNNGKYAYDVTFPCPSGCPIK